MKEPVKAPFYACIYEMACKIARDHGYALAVHGSMGRDLDFIAIPWQEECSERNDLIRAMKDAFEWCKEDWPDERIEKDITYRPHGRSGIVIMMDFQHTCYIDLSIINKKPAK